MTTRVELLHRREAQLLRDFDAAADRPERAGAILDELGLVQFALFVLDPPDDEDVLFGDLKE